MLRTLRLPLAAALALAAAGPVAAQPAGKNVSLPYPAKAPLVVAVNGWQKTTERLTKMTDALPQAEAEKVRGGLELGIDKVFEGRKTESVPGDRRLFGVIHDFSKLGDEEPAFAVLLPVTGYTEFKRSFLTAGERDTVAKAGKGVESVEVSFGGGPAKKMFLADLKDYVALSPSEEVAASYAAPYTRAQSGSMGPDLSGTFMAADAAVYVNMEVINDLYGEQIRSVKGLIDFGLGQAEMQGKIPGLDGRQIDVVKTMFTGLLQGVEDAQGLLLAMEFRPEGLRFAARTRFTTDSPTSTALAAEAPAPLTDLGKLPQGLGVYGGWRFGRKLSDTFRPFTQNFTAPDGQDETDAKITKLLNQVSAAGAGVEVTGSSGSNAGIVMSQYKNAKQAAAGLVGAYGAVPVGGKVMGVVTKEKTRVTDAAQTHRGFTFAEMKLAFDFEATIQSLPEQARETTLGNLKRVAKERMTFWIGTDGKTVATLTAEDWGAASKLLDDYLDGTAGVGTEAGFKTTRSNLPADATAVYLAETSQAVQMITDQVKGIPTPNGRPAIGKLGNVQGGEPTYLGFALTLKPQGAGVDVFVPGTAMNVAARMLAGAFRRVE
ncbi:MAG: hypothetical protein U0804_14175 [Gemmataceae bacterium]